MPLPLLGLLAGAGMAYGMYGAGKRLISGADMIADGKTWDGVKEMGAGTAEGVISAVPGTGVLKGVGAVGKAVGAGKLVGMAGKIPGATTIGSVAAPIAAYSMVPGSPAAQAGAQAGAGQTPGDPTLQPGWAPPGVGSTNPFNTFQAPTFQGMQ